MKGRTIPKVQYQYIHKQSLRMLILLIPALFCPSLKAAVATEAPTKPRNKRVITVAKSGSSNYSSIQAALNNAKPGDTIQVKDGVYDGKVVFKVSGTKSDPIALVNYPGHNPVIRPGSSKSLGSVQKDEKIYVRSSWVIIDGFEITNGWHGIYINKPHVTVRNNWIHDNSQSGILTTSGNLLIQDNIVEWNGVKTCKISGKISPRHCHGMYISDNGSQKVSDITIKGNTIEKHAGNGIMLKTAGGSGHRNHLVENNLIRDNAQNGIAIFKKVYDSKFLNNDIIAKSTPSSNSPNSYLVSIDDGTGNLFKGNIFYTTLSDTRPFAGNTSNSSQNTFDYNSWSVKSQVWRWKGSARKDFKPKYQPTTGWDRNGEVM